MLMPLMIKTANWELLKPLDNVNVVHSTAVQYVIKDQILIKDTVFFTITIVCTKWCTYVMFVLCIEFVK